MPKGKGNGKRSKGYAPKLGSSISARPQDLRGTILCGDKVDYCLWNLVSDAGVLERSPSKYAIFGHTADHSFSVLYTLN